MNISLLIEKHGTEVEIDDKKTKIFIDAKKVKLFKNKALNDYFDTCLVLSREPIYFNTIVLIDGIRYKWLETRDAPMQNGRVYYYETLLYKDEFILDIEIYKQSLGVSGCNLPSVDETKVITHKALIKTKKSSDYINYALQGAKVPTHQIVSEYIDGVSTGDLIKLGSKNFEILFIENIDEKNQFLVFDVIEVL